MSAAVELVKMTDIAAPSKSVMPARRPIKRRRTSNVLPSPEESPSSPVEKTDALDEISLSDISTAAVACDADSASSRILARATHTLQVETAALNELTKFYTTSQVAQQSLLQAVRAILLAQRRRAKLVVCGVGKSGYIGQKLVATLKSLGVSASFMHACEAAHGDLGDVRGERGDTVLFITFSGRTPELRNVIDHLPPDVRVMAMSKGLEVEDCQILREWNDRCDRDDFEVVQETEYFTYQVKTPEVEREDNALPRTILIPTPIHEPEEESFGVCAPTTSTTVALAVADMIALAVAEEMHQGRTKLVFKRNHPGGAIGMTNRAAKRAKKDSTEDIAIVELPSPSISAESED